MHTLPALAILGGGLRALDLVLDIECICDVGDGVCPGRVCAAALYAELGKKVDLRRVCEPGIENLIATNEAKRASIRDVTDVSTGSSKPRHK